MTGGAGNEADRGTDRDAVRGVGIGTAIVSYVEPHPGVAREFNRWYERDHFYAAVTAGPGAYAGARWVATRACKAVRASGELFGDPARGSYLAAAWLLPGTQEDWDAWIGPQMATLREQGRMFAGRDHLHTAVYSYAFEVVDGAGPPACVALDRGFDGVVMVASTAGEQECEEWARALIGPDLPLVVGLRREQVLVSTLGEPADHVVMLGFVADEVLQVWEQRVEPALAVANRIGFASPFLRTVPGTDAYTDDL